MCEVASTTMTEFLHQFDLHWLRSARSLENITIDDIFLPPYPTWLK
jgi:hypothetical protein